MASTRILRRPCGGVARIPALTLSPGEREARGRCVQEPPLGIGHGREDGDRQAAAFADAAVGWVQAFEAKYSRFRPDSLVSRINQAAGLGWIGKKRHPEDAEFAKKAAARFSVVASEDEFVKALPGSPGGDADGVGIELMVMGGNVEDGTLLIRRGGRWGLVGRCPAA